MKQFYFSVLSVLFTFTCILQIELFVEPAMSGNSIILPKTHPNLLFLNWIHISFWNLESCFYFVSFLQELKINLDHPKLSGEKTVQNAIAEVAAIMGENVKLRRTFAMSAPSQGIISTYLHTSPQPGIVISNCSLLCAWIA